MIRIDMKDSTLSNKEAAKWVVDMLDKNQSLNLRFKIRTSQFEELKAILNERAVISKATTELVKK